MMTSLLRVRHLLLLIVGVLLLPTALEAQGGPLTVAEESGFRATSRHSDVMSFIGDLQRLSPLIRVETMATTVEGKIVPLVIIGDPPPSSPAELRYDERAVVYIQANIHAGEVEGKEAALMLARDILLDNTPDYLDKLVVLLAPNFNPDGNDKISTENRTRQNGPEQGVGIRYNGQNLDLNRDALKLETPEVLGFVENVLSRWDPLFLLDIGALRVNPRSRLFPKNRRQPASTLAGMRTYSPIIMNRDSIAGVVLAPVETAVGFSLIRELHLLMRPVAEWFVGGASTPA